MRIRINGVAATAILCCFAMGSAAQSRAPAPMSPEALLDGVSVEQRAHLKSLMSEMARQRVQTVAASTDTTRPALTAFNATKSIDVAAQGARFAAAVQATDDESGVEYLWVSGYGPRNQRVSLYLYSTPPSRRLAGFATARENTPFHEPGEYRFTTACVYDLAGNGACYDEAGLAALGQNRMTVVNRRGYDVTPPELVRGRVLTPWISLSQPHPGTTEPSFAGVEFELQDTGDSALAGG